MKMFHSFRVFILFVLCQQIASSAIPIWELLSHQEKIGQLMYLFLNMVDVYCKNSLIPDCEKVLTLYGTSNLINQREDVLDLMDPYQRNAREILWSNVMNREFDLPSEMRSLPFPTNPHAELEDGLNQIGDYDINFPDYTEYQDASVASGDPQPYAVRVPAPNSDFKDETFALSGDDSAPNYRQEPSNIAQVSSSSQKTLPQYGGGLAPVGNLNRQQQTNSRNVQTDIIASSDKKLVTDERSFKEENPQPRNYKNYGTNKLNAAQSSHGSEPSLVLRILKS